MDIAHNQMAVISAVTFKQIENNEVVQLPTNNSLQALSVINFIQTKFMQNIFGLYSVLAPPNVWWLLIFDFIV